MDNKERIEESDRNLEDRDEEVFHDTSISSDWMEEYERRNNNERSNIDENTVRPNRTNQSEIRMEDYLNKTQITSDNGVKYKNRNANMERNVETAYYNHQASMSSTRSYQLPEFITRSNQQQLQYDDDMRRSRFENQHRYDEYYHHQNEEIGPDVRTRTSSPQFKRQQGTFNHKYNYQGHPQYNTQNVYNPSRHLYNNSTQRNPWNGYYEPRFSLNDIEALKNLNVNTKPTRTSDVDIKGIELFTGEGNKYEIIKNLRILFAELEKRFDNINLSDCQKLILLQQTLSREPKCHLMEEDITSYEEAKTFLIDLYTPNIVFEEAIADMKKLRKKEDEAFEHFARRVKAHANIIAQKCRITLESDLIFIPMTETLMYAFPNQYQGSDAIIRAKENKSFECLLSALLRIVRIDPVVWQNKKETTKVKIIANDKDNTNKYNIDNSNKHIYENNYPTNNNKNLETKMNDNNICQYCKLQGHNIEECQLKINKINPRNFQIDNKEKEFDRFKCTHCGSKSHNINKCWERHPHLAPYWHPASPQYNNNDKNKGEDQNVSSQYQFDNHKEVNSNNYYKNNTHNAHKHDHFKNKNYNYNNRSNNNQRLYNHNYNQQNF